MLRAPALNPGYAFESVEGEGLAAFSEDKELFLQGRLYCDLAQVADGKRSADALAEGLSPQWPLAEIYFGLEVFEQAGLAVEAFRAPPSDAAFWDRLEVHADVAAERLASTNVSLHVCGELPGSDFAAALLQAGVRIADHEAPHISVVVTDDYLRPELEQLARRARESGSALFLARPIGASIWLGPIFEPTEAGCWCCLARRLDFNRSRERMVRSNGGRRFIRRAQAYTPSSLCIAAHHVAQQVALRAVLGQNPSLSRSLVTIDHVALTARRHHVQPFPQCPVCGDPDLAAKRDPRISLRSTRALVPNDTGSRTRDPAETLGLCAHLVSPITGIIDDLAPVKTGQLAGASLVTIGLVAEPFTRGHLRNWETRILAAGKGTTEPQARASALCEAIERHSSCFRGDEPRRRARWDEVSDCAVHPEQILQFSDAQYASRERYNRCYSHPKYWVSERFDNTRSIEWSAAWSLSHESIRWVPTAFCYFGYTDSTGQARFARADSNGAAAGNTLEEAVLQGLLELIERDAAAVWWFNRLQRPAVDLACYGDPFVQRALERYRDAGRELWAVDLTTDLGVPVFAVVSRRLAGPREEIVYGFGCHLTPRVALLRAMTECDQSFVSALRLSSNPSDLYDGDRVTWLNSARVADHPYLLADASAAPTRLPDLASLSTGDLRDEIQDIVERLRRIDVETVVLDLTRPDMPLPVVKLFAPGLCHPWRRLGNARLFDLPVRLGWLAAPRREEDINPTVKL